MSRPKKEPTDPMEQARKLLGWLEGVEQATEVECCIGGSFSLSEFYRSVDILNEEDLIDSGRNAKGQVIFKIMEKGRSYLRSVHPATVVLPAEVNDFDPDTISPKNIIVFHYYADGGYVRVG